MQTCVWSAVVARRTGPNELHTLAESASRGIVTWRTPTATSEGAP